jgi:hypothetical protein
MQRTVCLAVPFLVLAACAPAPSGEPVFEVDDAFLIAPAAGMDIAGAGMTVTTTGKDVALIGATSPLADRVELHIMEMTEDSMRMRRVDELAFAKGQPLKLQRGGSHLMLFGIDQPLVAGESADITLTFRTPGGKTVDVVATAEIVEPGQ